MYSPRVISILENQARQQGLKLTRLPRERSIEISSKINKLRFKDEILIPDGGLVRPLDAKEQEFIASEMALCRIDFEYYFTRYHCVEIDAGAATGDNKDSTGLTKIMPPILLPSQSRFIKRLADREEECHREYKKYGLTPGIRAVFHKVRQVAATAVARGITWHRMLFWPGTRCFAASLDETRVAELYRRDEIALERFPFWMVPRISTKNLNETIGFASPVSGRCVYQHDKQVGGLGVGTQQDSLHLTEVGLWANVGYIKYSLLPALPQSKMTCLIMESTSNGKGNYWHELTEDVRHKREGFEDWIYEFVPWWVNSTKYRANVPEDWTPKKHTLEHAKLIEKTSPEFNYGVIHHPSREQLYWWEKMRIQHARHGELAAFLTNYPATPEQSFQNPVNGAFPPEFIEKWENLVNFPPGRYDLNLAELEGL